MIPKFNYAMQNPKDIEQYHICQKDNADYVILDIDAFNRFFKEYDDIKTKLLHLNDTDVMALASEQAVSNLMEQSSKLKALQDKHALIKKERGHYINLRTALVTIRDKAKEPTEEETCLV